MNSIVKKGIQLPANIEDLSKFVLIGREKLISVRAEIRAIDKLDLANDVRTQKKEEAQGLASALLDAEARLGDLLKEIPKETGGDRRSEEFQSNTAVTLKKDKIKDLGFGKMQVSRFESLSDNKDIIEEVKAEAIENDDLPTRTEVLRKVKEREKKNALEQRSKEIENNIKASLSIKPIIRHMDAIDFLNTAEPADLLLTDPPYSTDIDDIDKFAAEWLPLALSNVKSTGSAFIFIGAYPKELKAYLNVWLPHQVLIWEYKNTLGQNPKGLYKQNYQAILFYKGENAPNLNIEVTNEQWAVQSFNAPDGRLGDRYHAWQKPIELAERLITHTTKEGDSIIDPFCCTGTFLLAAAKMKRNATGCDISEENLSIAQSRGCVYG